MSDYVNLVLGVLLLMYSPKGKKHPIEKQMTLWYLAFMLFIAISILWSISPKHTLFVLGVRVFPLFCLSFTLFRYINSYGGLFLILRLFYISCVILFFYFIFFVDLSTVGDERISVGEDLEKTWNINSVAMQFAMAIYAGYFLFWKAKHKNFRPFWIIMSAAMLVVIIITGSRKGLLFMLIPIAVLTIYEMRDHFIYAVGLAVAGITFLYAVMTVPFLYETMGVRIVDMIDVASGTNDHTQDDSRMLLILAGWEWFLENPIHGYGMNCFRILSDNDILFMGRNWYAHNNYIEILVGGGVIGFLVYYSYLLFVIKRFWGRRDMPYKIVGVLIVLLLFGDMAQVGYYTPEFQYMILLVFVILNLEEKKSSALMLAQEI
jgi:O-antigen ligase